MSDGDIEKVELDFGSRQGDNKGRGWDILKIGRGNFISSVVQLFFPSHLVFGFAAICMTMDMFEFGWITPPFQLAKICCLTLVAADK